MVYESVPGFCREFLFYKRNVQNLSQKTVDQYYLDMKLFFQWLADENDIKSPSVEIPSDGRFVPVEIVKKLTFGDLLNYLNYTTSELDNHARARARKISSLRGFFRYLQKNNIIDENPALNLEVPKMPKELPVHLKQKNFWNLLTARIFRGIIA